MDASGSHESNRAYYDAFSEGYEDHRGENDPGGYHELLDELESEFVQRFGSGRDVLEVGCGTGLVLQRIRRFAKSAKGIDLSPGMLARARERGLSVVEGSATALPFEDESFDVTCSFKVLAHIPEIDVALKEMLRVTRPHGTVIAEFYNPHSLRGLVKRYGPAGRIAPGAHEKHVYTRFDSPRDVQALLPAGCEIVASRGVRIATPTARLMRLPVARTLLRATERALCDSPLARFGGFWIAAIRKP
ncbi:MAG: methyltransferase domain-containing protein [Myxococcales bacterium]|nr:methyltransferase domain-containing protein [Myxococcales bacterium]MCB9576870.1 methyltransferase domain-containing protein [Polyangiaceae bacterium]